MLDLAEGTVTIVVETLLVWFLNTLCLYIKWLIFYMLQCGSFFPVRVDAMVGIIELTCVWAS